MLVWVFVAVDVGVFVLVGVGDGVKVDVAINSLTIFVRGSRLEPSSIAPTKTKRRMKNLRMRDPELVP